MTSQAGLRSDIRIARAKTVPVSRSSGAHQTVTSCGARRRGGGRLGVPQRPPGQAEEDVVQAGPAALDPADRDARGGPARGRGSTSAAPPCGTRPTTRSSRTCGDSAPGSAPISAATVGDLARRRSTVTVRTSPPTCDFSSSGVPRGDDRAGVDDQDAVAERVGLVEVVGGEEDRRPPLLAQPADVLPEVGPRLRVEPGGRLVEEDQARARAPGRRRCPAGAAGRRTSSSAAAPRARRGRARGTAACRGRSPRRC